MEFDEQEEGMQIPNTQQPPSYDSLGNSVSRSKLVVGVDRRKGGIGGGGGGFSRYRECQKNHAVSYGGHAIDGCCEFMSAGEEGTLEAMICAACNCHRNFHRKEIDGETVNSCYRQQQQQQQPFFPPPQFHQFPPYFHHRAPPGSAGYLHHHLATPVAHHRPLALPAAGSGRGMEEDQNDMSNPSSSSGGGSGRKRFRTKFTSEQKDKMLGFAEKIGWRFQKHDEAAIEEFCAETCIKRNVLKIWMHNNRNTLGKKP